MNTTAYQVIGRDVSKIIQDPRFSSIIHSFRAEISQNIGNSPLILVDVMQLQVVLVVVPNSAMRLAKIMKIPPRVVAQMIRSYSIQ